MEGSGSFLHLSAGTEAFHEEPQSRQCQCGDSNTRPQCETAKAKVPLILILTLDGGVNQLHTPTTLPL